jgi:hypothetical protein
LSDLQSGSWNEWSYPRVYEWICPVIHLALAGYQDEACEGRITSIVDAKWLSRHDTFKVDTHFMGIAPTMGFHEFPRKRSNSFSPHRGINDPS